MQEERKVRHKELITKINELNSYINIDGFYKESKEKEGEIRKIYDEILEDQAAIIKNTALLNDSEIRDEMRKFYQQTFNKQTVKEGTGAIDKFFNSDAGTNPYEELKKRVSKMKQGTH